MNGITKYVKTLLKQMNQYNINIIYINQEEEFYKSNKISKGGKLRQFLPWFVNIGEEGYLAYNEAIDERIIKELIDLCSSSSFAVSRKSYEIINLLLKCSIPEILKVYEKMGLKSIKEYYELLRPKAAIYIQSVFRGNYYGGPYRKRLEKIFNMNS